MYEAIVIGVSAGGMKALSTILPQLPSNFPLAVIIVQHQPPDADDFLSQHLNEISQLIVSEVCPGERILPGNVYISVPGYHVQVEKGKTLSLSVDLPVNFSIPSIDVLFETAADVYQEYLVGIILTGGNADGAQGLKTVKEYGGLAIVQNPDTAEIAAMPKAAVNATRVDHILHLNEISPFIRRLAYEH